MTTGPQRSRLETIAWLGFAASGVLYLVSGIESRDGLVVIGSVIWLAAVGMFIVAGRR